MPRALTSKTKLESLRKEAKRWLKALRAGDAGAMERLNAAFPKVSGSPGLRPTAGHGRSKRNMWTSRIGR